MKDELKIKNEILEAAKGLIQQFGMNKPTMRDVAKAAGKGKSTLYYYFKNKEEIFDAVVMEEMKEFFLSLKNAVDKEESVEAKLKTYLVARAILLKNKCDKYKIIIENESHYFDIKYYFSINWKENESREKKLIHSILKTGVENGKINKSKIEGKEGTLLAESFLTYMRGVEIEVFVTNQYSSASEKAEMLVDILLKGLK